MLRIGINGIGGRMGRELIAAGAEDASLVIVGGVERAERVATAAAELGDALLVVSDLSDLLPAIDVLIDFSTPESALAAARGCAETGTPLVCGTTGLSAANVSELQALSERTAIFYSRNMSVGVNALIGALPALVQALDGYDIEIVESHHRHKMDAPSGTALALAEAIASGLRVTLADHVIYGREGISPRQPGEIGIHAVRAGGNAGEHTITIADDGEEISLRHRAYSRRTFANGALRAARYIASKPPCMMTMADLIGERG